MQAITEKITLNCKGKLLVLDQPVVMGILNTTPDSFFSESRVNGEQAWVDRAGRMLAEGAALLDIGGYSTRPGAIAVSEAEEMQRVIPAIEAVSRAFPGAVLSVDTFRASVAREAVKAGAAIINDISAGEDDPDMLQTVAGLQVPYILMHKRGTPATMQQLAQYEDVVLEVMNYLLARTKAAEQAGITDLILDPGFGFAKRLEHNYTLLRSLADFRILGYPLLAGLSRKKMIREITGTEVDGALNGTTVLNTMALMDGARILRVHDVKEAVECVKLVSARNGII